MKKKEEWEGSIFFFLFSAIYIYIEMVVTMLTTIAAIDAHRSLVTIPIMAHLIFDAGASVRVKGEKPLCSICYEDLKPIINDLQSISLCGHIFHDFFLQQWLEYCPSEKKPTCPVCKQSCSHKSLTRLYFSPIASMLQHWGRK